jgi:hypothetical protein
MWKVVLVWYNTLPYILLRTPVPSFSGRESITFNLKVLALAITLVEVLASAILILGTTVEIIEHEVHVLSLLSL